MSTALIAIVTYALSSLLAIAGMGAAGVLIPNYVALGLSIGKAILLTLTRNVIRTNSGHDPQSEKKLIIWRNIIFGLYTHCWPHSSWLHNS